jgi:hypothetical protein
MTTARLVALALCIASGRALLADLPVVPTPRPTPRPTAAIPATPTPGAPTWTPVPTPTWTPTAPTPVATSTVPTIAPTPTALPVATAPSAVPTPAPPFTITGSPGQVYKLTYTCHARQNPPNPACTMNDWTMTLTLTGDANVQLTVVPQ